MPSASSAPGALELVRAFVNTVDPDTGADRLADPAQAAQWAAERELEARGAGPRDGELHLAREVRDALRAMLRAHNGEELDPAAPAVLDRAARATGLSVRFTMSGATLSPHVDGFGSVVGRVLAAVAGGMADGTWPRMKACRDESCAVAFYDRSKNRSRTWCSMAVCGNRTKVRAYRERRGRRRGANA